MKIEDILKGMAFIIEENGSIEYNAKGLKKILDYITTLQRKEYNNSKAIEYIHEKQKIQYKYALSHIECDELEDILEKGE